MSDPQDLSFDDFDEWRRPPPTVTDFDQVLATALSRRGLLQAGLGVGAAALALSGSDVVGGFWTPATALGAPYIDALVQHAGLTFEVL